MDRRQFLRGLLASAAAVPIAADGVFVGLDISTEATSYVVSGFDAYGNPASETIEMLQRFREALMPGLLSMRGRWEALEMAAWEDILTNPDTHPCQSDQRAVA